MVIEPNSEVVLDKGLRILKKLTRFQRLSPQAQITYDDPDEDSEDEACVLEAMVIDDPVLELLYAQEWLDVSLNQLRRVHMYNISRTRSELEFIKLLLAKSPMLETMLIETDWEEVADKGLRILKELTRFLHSSPKAEITYNDSDGGLSDNETSEDEV
ncbi:F-box/FBD/LRR-repeat protein [Camellia lanceoleosa]|uniref:F-box/FBD/LRR-repeat protein n=1 Tax=Camellia lanceoleosa TaxID=1840588 RepID=A0ACC0I8Z7_9ERIC|nr:F-box/FBD/LRR-repeat protein [Camellia lanceoleosa]